MQIKLAQSMWTPYLVLSLGNDGPVGLSVKPESMFGVKMVEEAFVVAGGDTGTSTRNLGREALADEFATATGRYFGTDAGRIVESHPDAFDPRKAAQVMPAIY